MTTMSSRSVKAPLPGARLRRIDMVPPSPLGGFETIHPVSGNRSQLRESISRSASSRSSKERWIQRVPQKKLQLVSALRMCQ